MEYEYRFKKTEPLLPNASPNIEKLNEDNFKTKGKLLVVSEQGIGDVFQFMRYIPYLIKQDFDVSFCAPEKLHELIKTSNISKKLLTPEEGNKVKEGRWIPLMSLPLLLDINPSNPIITDSYIHSSKKLNDKWKKILAKEKSVVIGINWQGNPTTEKSHLKGRSIPLKYFSKLTEDNDFKFLSLQKGFGSEQLENCLFKDSFVSCQDEVNQIWNFLETAAIISNCDLIITSDTSVAHLSAGLGKPTWCLLHSVPDWRWGLNGEESFWYPSLRLFRQIEKDNWSEVMDKVKAELNNHFLN